MSAANRLARDVAESLRSQPGRVGLSFLAVMIGIVVLTLLLALLQGLNDQARRMIQRFGANVVAAVPDAGPVQRQGFRGLEQLTAHLGANLTPARVSPMARLGDTVAAWDRTPVWAVGRELAEIRGWSLIEGRMFDELDERNGARVAVITEAVQQRWNAAPGGLCQIGPHPFTIVGVLREGSGLPDDAARPDAAGDDSLVLIPSVVAERCGLAMDPSAAALFIRPAGERIGRDVATAADAVMRDPAWAGWKIRWVTPESLLRGIRELQQVIALTAGSIALLCLLLGGTTLMSLMLADVRQRIPEIGLRRSLGATQRDIALLFVVESCVITGGAALAGLVVAAVLLAGLAGHGGVPIGINYFTFVIPVIVSIVIGGAFSFWPARLAAGWSPALALRNA